MNAVIPSFILPSFARNNFLLAIRSAREIIHADIPFVIHVTRMQNVQSAFTWSISRVEVTVISFDTSLAISNTSAAVVNAERNLSVVFIDAKGLVTSVHVSKISPFVSRHGRLRMTDNLQTLSDGDVGWNVVSRGQTVNIDVMHPVIQTLSIVLKFDATIRPKGRVDVAIERSMVSVVVEDPMIKAMDILIVMIVVFSIKEDFNWQKRLEEQKINNHVLFHTTFLITISKRLIR